MSPESDQLLAGFFGQLENQQCVSPHTMKAYQRDLGQLVTYCGQHQLHNWLEVTSKQLRYHIAQRHRSGLGGKSLQRELSAIRAFFNYLLADQHISQNPAQYLTAPKASQKLPKLLDVDQVNALLDAETTGLLQKRDLAMFELFYSSGLRLAELSGLDFQDLDLGNGLLKVCHGKGGKSRVVPVGSKAVLALRQWLGLRGSLAGANQPAVFVSQQGIRLSQRGIQLRLKQWAIRQGLAEHVHPHMFRHSCASHLLESSQNLRAVQELLGHSSINSTQIYTHLDFQHLASVYDQAHPRAKKKPSPTVCKQNS